MDGIHSTAVIPMPFHSTIFEHFLSDLCLLCILISSSPPLTVSDALFPLAFYKHSLLYTAPGSLISSLSCRSLDLFSVLLPSVSLPLIGQHICFDVCGRMDKKTEVVGWVAYEPHISFLALCRVIGSLFRFLKHTQVFEIAIIPILLPFSLPLKRLGFILYNNIPAIVEKTVRCYDITGLDQILKRELIVSFT